MNNIILMMYIFNIFRFVPLFIRHYPKGNKIAVEI